MIRALRNFGIRAGALVGALVLTCALTCAGSAGAAPLGQAVTGTVTGQVLSLDDVALPNVHLAAFTQAPGTPNRNKVGEFQSDAQGRYSIQVPTGQIWIEFETQDINGQSFWGYDNLPVDVAAGQTVTGQDFRVAIRIVSEPPTAVPQAPTAVPTAMPVATPVMSPGMPATGAGPNMWVPLAGVLGALMMALGLVQRRRAPR